jgi:ACS family tartrate transporter-like MFS transporter
MSSDTIGKIIERRVGIRLIPPCILLMLLSSLDRVNVSFAALQMNEDLGFSPEQYGFGAGIFFVGYLVGQYPSILLQKRFGMRLWVSVCALMWGIAATGLAFIDSAAMFYALRIIIGLAEGGLASGIVLYLCQWSTDADRARMFALPMLAIPISTIIGAPLSGWLLTMDAPLSMTNWRWMFLAEGLPAVLVGIAAYFYFPNHPREAQWLTPAEQDWLARNSILASGGPRANTASDYSVLRNPLIWLTASVWFVLLAGAYGIIFWLPQIIEHSTGHSAFVVSAVSAVPWVGAAIGIMLNSWHSDRTRERFWHIGLPILGTAVCIAVSPQLQSDVVALAMLLLTGVGLGAAQGVFWTMPTTYLSPGSLTVAVPAINIAGSSAGLVIPQLIGWTRATTGSFELPLYLVAGMLLAGAIMVAVIRATVRHLPPEARTPGVETAR